MQLYRPSPRAWAAIAILLAWGGALAWLAARRLNQTEAAVLSTEAALRLAPGAAWFALYSGDTQVGQAGITVDTLSPGYQVTETFAIETPADSGVLRASRYTVTKVSAALVVTSVTSRLVLDRSKEAWAVSFPAGRLAIAREGTIGTDNGIPVTVAPTTTAILPYRLALTGWPGPRAAAEPSRAGRLAGDRGHARNDRRARLDGGVCGQRRPRSGVRAVDGGASRLDPAPAPW
ncbi:MAG: hypothetical protein V9E87_01705 [Gemmatimonadales bacterium]